MTRSLHRPYPRAVTESDSRARGERNFSRRPQIKDVLSRLYTVNSIDDKYKRRIADELTQVLETMLHIAVDLRPPANVIDDIQVER